MSALFFIFDAVNSNWLNKSAKYLKKVYFRNDKRVAAYFVCVVIATGFWFLNALSKTYTVDIVAPVHYVNFPDNKTLANKQPEEIDLTIRAHGFTILRQKLSFILAPLEFNVNELTNNRMKESKKSLYAFPSRQFLNQLSYKLSNDLEILNMSPDTLFFKFDAMGHKRVKIKPTVKIDLKKQFQLSGDITTEPDSIWVNGPQLMLDTLRNLKTETILQNAVDEPIHKNIKINPVKNLYFETQTVRVNIPVEEYTEAQEIVPVSLINQPADVKIKLFPVKVKITFQVGLNRFSGVHPEDFRLTVNYDDILKGKQKLKIIVNSTPAYIYDLKITPEELEYLIEN